MNQKHNYGQKLRDPRWQKMRLKVMERDAFCCSKCLSESNTLNVHHKRYIDGREPWDYPLHYLVTLCEHCHKQEHSQDISHAISSLIAKGVSEEAILKSLDKRCVDFAKNVHPALFQYIRVDELMRKHIDSDKATRPKLKLPIREDFE